MTSCIKGRSNYIISRSRGSQVDRDNQQFAGEREWHVTCKLGPARVRRHGADAKMLSQKKTQKQTNYGIKFTL